MFGRRLLFLSVLGLWACAPADRPTRFETNVPLAHIADDVGQALDAFPSAQALSIGAQGVPTMVQGELGRIGDPLQGGDVNGAVTAAMTRVGPLFRLQAKDMQVARVQHDALKFTHVRLKQTKNGLEVVGGDLVLHIDATGQVYSVGGTAHDGTDVSATPALPAEQASVSALAGTQGGQLRAGTPRLVYVVTEDINPTLAWEVQVDGMQADGTPLRDRVYVNAQTGQLALRRPMIHTSLSRKIYDGKHGTALPGKLVRSEGGAATSDTSATHSYDHLGDTYNCYQQLFNRDSLDDNGLQLVSTVHYSVSYNNAFWDGNQMVFGDGDGQELANLADALDVTAHELTHGVTQYTANLDYQDEPGALNEAFSDIMGAVCEAHVNGGVNANTWKVGEDIYTPNIPGDALRYMDNPTLDNYSADYYPERLTGSSDNGGVHGNSGIANLAFKLLTTGGTHPRNKTNVTVPGLGIDKAAAIFYRALTQYMTSSTQFQGARTATAQAAADLYGASEQAAVNAAWSAVGAPGGGVIPPPGDGGTPDSGTPPGSGELQNGVPQTGLSGTTAAELRFTLTVPAGATGLSFKISGGTGDADLYVKFGSAPTTSSYDYRPYLNGNTETVTVPTGMAGTWYVLVRGYAAFSAVTLVGQYTPAGSGGGDGGTPTDATVLTSGVPLTGLSGAVASQNYFRIDVPVSASHVQFTLSGGTGDADLYVRFGSKPTTSTWDYRPYLYGNNESVSAGAKAGTWYVMLRGYAAYSGATLTASY